MKTTSQQILFRVWTEPVTCQHQELPALLTDAAQAGFECVRLQTHQQGYTATFQLIPEAAESREARPADMQARNAPEINTGTLLFTPPGASRNEPHVRPDISTSNDNCLTK